MDISLQQNIIRTEAQVHQRIRRIADSQNVVRTCLTAEYLLHRKQFVFHDYCITYSDASGLFKVLVLNKTDLVEPKNLLGIIDSFKDAAYDAILPVSARTGDGIGELKKELTAHLPVGPKYFPDDMLTDQPERDICAELIREKALRNLRDEVPHGIGVEMMAMKKLNDHFTEIDATIYCERVYKTAIPNSSSAG